MTKKHTVIVISAIFALVIAGCFVISTVNQPSTIMGLQQFTATLVVSVEGISDANPHYAIVGMKIPNDWTVDSVWYAGGYNNYCTYLHPDSPDAEPGGQVDFWTDSLEGRFPSGANMKWVVYQSVTNHAVLADTVDVNLNIKMTPGVTQGTFNIGYFTTDAALDFTDPTYYSASLNNSITVSGIVPVELASFKAAGTQNGVVLTWETASETNNLGFEIERSRDNNVFNTIGFVNGNRTTTERSIYTFLDKAVTNGKYYYRLKQIDFNGNYEYSKVLEVDFSVPAEFNLSQNYPNPFNPSTMLQFGLPVESDVTLSVYNSLGELVETLVQGRLNAGTHKVNFEVSGLSSGLYLYSIHAKGSNGVEFTKTSKMFLLK